MLQRVDAPPAASRRGRAAPPLPAAVRVGIAALSSLRVRAVQLVGAVLPATGARPAAPVRLATARSILVVRPDEIGDVVLTTAFLRELRRAAPRARITLVVKPEVRNVVDRCPYVDEVLTFATAGGRWTGEVARPVRALRAAVGRLRPLAAEIAFVPRWDVDRWGASFLAYWAGAPVRVGHSERVLPFKRVINRGFDRLLTHPVCDTARKHEVERTLDLLRSLGHQPASDRLELWTDADDDGFAVQFFAARGVTPADRVVALNPSAGHSVLKQWPVEHFSALARRLAADGCTKVLVIGSRGDAALGRAIAEAAPASVLDATGQTTLRQTVALLRRADVCVTTDTGPMHMAVAAGVPVVALFGSSDYRSYGPRHEHRVLSLDLACSPAIADDKRDRCNHCELGEPRCMIDLPVARAYAAVHELSPPRRHLPLVHGP